MKKLFRSYWLPVVALVILFCYDFLIKPLHLHLQPERTYPNEKITEVIAFEDFSGGRAFILQGRWEPILLTTVQRGVFWTGGCWTGGLEPPAKGPPIGAFRRFCHPTKGEIGVLAFAGIIKDPRVSRIRAGDQERNVEGRGSFLFAWRTDHEEAFLPALAYDASGQVLYELRNLGWVAVSP